MTEAAMALALCGALLSADVCGGQLGLALLPGAGLEAGLPGGGPGPPVGDGGVGGAGGGATPASPRVRDQHMDAT